MINGQSISVSAKAAVIRDGKLLVTVYEEPFLHYNLPGGRLRNGESLEQAVVRKLREECCADVEVDRLLYVFEYIPPEGADDPAEYQKVQFNFLARLADGCEPRLPDTKGEEDGIAWLDLAAVADAPILPPVAGKLLEALAKLPEYDPLIPAHTPVAPKSVA
ncbi:NUDIX domain-containing protein [Nonomuraea sp. NPDC050451]|uniref:NUDIX domain-containing protein n=1 Tax=Nonomuraea sp. NPDC050451 TaxID=3364364 RepID=UPI0037A9D1AD